MVHYGNVSVVASAVRKLTPKADLAAARRWDSKAKTYSSEATTLARATRGVGEGTDIAQLRREAADANANGAALRSIVSQSRYLHHLNGTVASLTKRAAHDSGASHVKEVNRLQAATEARNMYRAEVETFNPSEIGTVNAVASPVTWDQDLVGGRHATDPMSQAQYAADATERLDLLRSAASYIRKGDQNEESDLNFREWRLASIVQPAPGPTVSGAAGHAQQAVNESEATLTP
jgi:hypothetical protein